MKKIKNNKGMTIVEILVSVCIISLVLTLLFSLLIQVKEEENNNDIQSNFLLNQSTFITQIEEDIVNYGVKAVSACGQNATGSSDDINYLANGENGNNFYCIKIYYAADYLKDNIGIIQVINYYQKYKVVDGVIVHDENSEPVWSIRYQRGSYGKCDKNDVPIWDSWKFNGVRIMKDMPSQIDLSSIPYMKYTVSTNKMNAASLVIPIANLEGEHYDINLSFTFNQPVSKETNGKDVNFICVEDSKTLNCKCVGDEGECNKTIVKANADEEISIGRDNTEHIKKYDCG